MKAKIEYIVFILSMLLIPTGLRSEVTQAGQYVGEQKNGNYLYAEVHQDDSVSLYLFDYAEDRLETWELQLTDDTATAISNYGREGAFRLETWELQLTDDTAPAIATIAGESFPLSYNSEVYDQTTYEGVVFVNEEGDFSTLLSRITRTAENSFVMFWGLPERGFEGGGVGSINNGQAEMLTTWGETVSFPFIPTPGLRTGRVNQLIAEVTSESGDTAFTFALVESERASMTNISTRGWTGGGQKMIAGTVVDGGHKLLLIRAVGPTLSGYGVSTAHPDPRITLFEGQTELASNDDWAGVDIANAAAHVGAFPLSEGSKDACLLVELAEGAYTIIVEGDGDPGEAIVEIYEVR